MRRQYTIFNELERLNIPNYLNLSSIVYRCYLFIRDMCQDDIRSVALQPRLQLF